MRIIILLTFLLLLNNCSLNSDSEFWTENKNKNKNNDDNNKLLLILNKSSDIMSMSFDEYKIYIEDYTKSSNYPDINK